MEYRLMAAEVEIVFGEIRSLNVEPTGVLMLRSDVVIVREAVDRGHVVSCFDECVGKVGADKAGGAGNDITHRARLPAEAGSPQKGRSAPGRADNVRNVPIL
jgi:hypothetical protein